MYISSCLIRNPRPKSVAAARSTNDNTSSFVFTRSETEPINVSNPISSSVYVHPQKMTSCGHYGIGQELCHVCHQRTKRNIPIYLHEEKRLREAEEDKLLNQYRDNQDIEEQKKQDVNGSENFEKKSSL